MHEQMNNQELKERLALIEAMIAEGRQRTESWGWTFVLWGLAYMIAITWANWGGSLAVFGRRGSLAWPVTMIAAAVLTLVIGLRQGKGQPETTMGRAIFSIWISVGVSMLLLFPALSMTERLDGHTFVALVAGMLAIANSASGLILKWRMQFGCALVWWVTCVAACFVSDGQLMVVFLAALFLCQIVFGVYAMVVESRRRRHTGVVHA